MRVVVQKVKESSVSIDNKIVGKINHGYTLFTGFTNTDNEDVVSKMVDKIINLRIFEDEAGKMNLDINSVKGSILSISQFTLYAKLSGRRPSFTDALNYSDASKLYDLFNDKIREKGMIVETGVFGADMKVHLINDGPTTILIDSEEI